MNNPLTTVQIQKLSSMQYKADTYRGMIIGFATSLENKINQFISEYFVSDNDKRNKFVAVFFSTNGLNFRHKQKIVMHILKTDTKFASFLQNNPNYLMNLDIIVSNRNDMAHSTLHSTMGNIDNFDDNKFQLHCFKPNNQGVFKSKLLDIDFSQLKPETDKIMALNIQTSELVEIANL